MHKVNSNSTARRWKNKDDKKKKDEDNEKHAMYHSVLSIALEVLTIYEPISNV